MMDVTLFGAFAAGLLSFLSPCVLPLVPPYLCYVSGISYDDLTDDSVSTRRVLPAAIVFVIGFSLVFVAFGATASALGQMVSANLDILTKVAGGLIMVFGLHFLGVFRISMLYREARLTLGHKGGLLGAFVLGLAFAFGWTPCVGPILAAILFVAGAEDSVWHGISLLFAYALGIGVPFILAAAFASKFLSWSSGLKRHARTIERISGVLLVGTGLLFMTGGMNMIGFWLLEAFPSLGNVG